MTDNYSYNEVIEFVKDKEIQFPDFSISFSKEIKSNKEGKSASLTKRVFTVKASWSRAQKLEVVYGQKPPKPLEFSVKGKIFTLYTFNSPEGEKLFDTKLYIKH